MDNNADDKKILNWIPTEDWKRPPIWWTGVKFLDGSVSKNRIRIEFRFCTHPYKKPTMRGTWRRCQSNSIHNLVNPRTWCLFISFIQFEDLLLRWVLTFISCNFKIISNFYWKRNKFDNKISSYC